MTITELLAYYKSGYRACLSIGVKKQNYTAWKRKDHIPYICQVMFEKHSHGALKAEHHFLDKHMHLNHKNKKEVNITSFIVFFLFMHLLLLEKGDY